MRTVERAVEWLRPLVDSKAWDYCVVWKLGDDPSRFIQWLGCCCSGGVESKGHVRVKEEKLEHPLTQICRDTHFQHHIRSKACEALALFPSSMDLYSGVHGDVVMSDQPRWIIHDKSDHLTGTQVLIPVFGGLIELFSAKNIPQNENITRLVISEFLGAQFLNLLPEAQPLPQLPHCIPCPTYGGSSIMSNPSFDSNSGSKSEDGSLKQAVGNYQSKNLVTERKRRTRIREGLYALRALVPKITKMDKASILGDAADYIMELQKEVKDLEDQLKELEEEEEEDDDLRKKQNPNSGAAYGLSGQSFAVSQNQCSNATFEAKPVEVQVEVNQVGKRDFLIKSMCEQRQGGFAKLMEAMNSLALRVVDANVTTSDGKVLNILRVETSKHVSPKQLRERLIQLT